MTCSKLSALSSTLRLIFALLLAASSGAMPAFATASPWVAGHHAKARLVAGDASPGEGTLLAFVEIALEPGWKTYWRSVGDAGGLPPSFDWAGSSNLASADVMFPAPQRFTDKSGNTIGYADQVMLPVLLRPDNAGTPITLKLDLHYAICKDVCIPVAAELAMDVSADANPMVPEEARDALARVPRGQDNLRSGDPVLVSASGHLSGGSPRLSITARFPDGSAGAEVFLEAPDGLFLPIPERVGSGTGDQVVFVADLSSDVDLAALAGKAVTVTLVSETGASVATFIPE